MFFKCEMKLFMPIIFMLNDSRALNFTHDVLCNISNIIKLKLRQNYRKVINGVSILEYV